jgi:flagellar basal body-associated protein FliL
MTEQSEQSQQPAKKSPKLTILIVGAVMLVEAAAAIGFIMLSGKGAAHAEAGIQGEQLADEEKTLEIELVSDRFQNLASGQAWTWNIEVVLQVRKKNELKVKGELERRKAEITEGVSLLIRRSAHSHLTEPGLETFHRQLGAYIEQIFGSGAEGEPLVERVIIPKCQGNPPE